jgi:hypothetical protein
LRVGQEFTRLNKKSAFSLKLNFVKAYDRVDNQCIYDTLAAMGFCKRFQSLVGGLSKQGQSKVHFNGLFTEPFQLSKGVPQGCPLSPLLFALTTQPMIRLMKFKEAAGYIQGIQITEEHSLLQQLFADDMGIFLTTTKRNFQEGSAR